VRVAFVILAHKGPAQIARLVRTLAGPGDVGFWIHLDVRSGSAMASDVTRALDGVEGVHMVDRRPVRWGGWGVVDATLAALEAIETSGEDPAQTVLLTGQDYPIRPPAEIVERLGSLPERAFMRQGPLPRSAWARENGGFDRFTQIHARLPLTSRTVRLPGRRRLPRGLALHGGSQLWSMGRAHRAAVLDFVRDEPRLVRFFRRSLIPDETFFQTVLMNSPLRHTVVADNLHYIRWSGEASPDTLTPRDLPELERSPAMFARKFDDPAMLDAVDSRLLRREWRATSAAMPAIASADASSSACSS
jgi:Core-2/I-Branching enzyme